MLDSYLDDLKYAVEEVCGERARGHSTDAEEREVARGRQAIIDHVTSLVEAAKKEGGENG